MSKNANMVNCNVAEEINYQQEDVFDTVFNLNMVKLHFQNLLQCNFLSAF